jgi:WD40 repeat protein
MPFDGFISYSHAADGRLAPAVQRGLHRLAKPWHRRRALWIFRDQTGLAVTPALWTSIQQALDGSQYFVLLASPEAANSAWVNREIEHWVATKSPDLILPVVTDGEWAWDPEARDFTADSTAVPTALRGVFGEEPLYLDLRWARDDLHLTLQHTRFRDAIAQLAAPMHGVSKDELEGEDVRQHRRARRLTAVAAATLALLTLVASLTGVIAMRNAERANGAVADFRRQQQVALEQRTTAEQATEESRRQQQNAVVQQGLAQDAVAETRRQGHLARQQQALAKEASAEAKREQAVAARYRASAERQRADAAQQQAEAQANARRQEELANDATARAKKQQELAEYHEGQAQLAEAERVKQEKRARDAAEQARDAAEQARHQTEAFDLAQRTAINRRLIGRARAMINEDPRKALMLGVAAQRLHSDAETRDQLSHLTMSTKYAGSFADVIDVVALAGQVVATVDVGGMVSLWNTADRAKPVRLASLPADSMADKTLTASPDGRKLAVLDGRTPVPDVRSAAVLWDVTKPARPVRIAALPGAQGLAAVRFSPDGHTVAASQRGEGTILWNVEGADPVLLASLPESHELEFSPDGRIGVIAGPSVTVWDLTDPATPVKIGPIPHPVRPDADIASTDVEFSSTMPVVAVRILYEVWLWDLTDPANPRSLQTTGAEVDLTSMAFGPDGRTLAIGDSSGTTALWKIEGDSWTRFANLSTAGGPVHSIAFSQDGKTLITGGDRRKVTLWDLKGRFVQDAIAELPGPYPGKIVGLAFGSGGRSLIAAGQEGTAARWDLADPAKPVRRDALPLHSGTIESVTLSRDARTMAVIGSDNTVTLLDMTRPAEPALLAKIKEDDDTVYTVRFSPDGLSLVISRGAGKLTLWDLADRHHPTPITRLGPFNAVVPAVAFSPDGRTMAIGEGFKLSLWDLTHRSAPTRLISISVVDDVGNHANSLAFSPDGRTLVAGTEFNAMAIVWDVSDPARPLRTATLTNFPHTVCWVGFSPDGRTLATATCWDNAIVLWDAADPATPLRYAELTGPDLQTSEMAFSPDGHTVAAGGTPYGGKSDTLMLWDAKTPTDLAADPIRYACAITGRGLNAEEWARYIPELDYRATC